MIRRDPRRIIRAQEPEDIMPGDFVTHGKIGPIGLVESIGDDYATVAWDKDRRDVLPLFVLRRAPQTGSIFDSRHGR
jgi:hypothetical protein